MSEITSITVGSVVTSLGDGMCRDMPSLVSVDFTQCAGNIAELPPSCFMGCSSFTDAVGLTALSAIGDCGFAGCTGLEHIDIPYAVTSVGTSAFAGCSGLT